MGSGWMGWGALSGRRERHFSQLLTFNCHRATVMNADDSGDCGITGQARRRMALRITVV